MVLGLLFSYNCEQEESPSSTLRSVCGAPPNELTILESDGFQVAIYLFVVLVVVHRGDGVKDLLVVIVHAKGVASLRQDDQEP